MNKNLCLSAILQLAVIFCSAQVRVSGLLTENLSDPVGLDIKAPCFSWKLTPAGGKSDRSVKAALRGSGEQIGNVVIKRREIMQTAYEIRVSTIPDDKGEVWISGKVSSGQSVKVPYAGPSPEPDKKYYWQVRVWDNGDRPSKWSSIAHWQTGLFGAGDWKARWIQPGYTEDNAIRASPIFRKEFSSRKKILSATAYITAHGLYEAQINGHRIGDAYLTPGWTSYRKRLQYQAYDVGSLIKEGANAIGVTLGSGWYRGYIAFEGQHNFYGKDISLLFQLAIHYSDGSTEIIGSDDSWKSATGAIRSSEIYDGETIDAREEKAGWSLPGYPATDWAGVKTVEFGLDNLIAGSSEPVRKHEVFPALRIITTPAGEKLIDFGQNLVGWVIVKVRGKAGDKIRISHAEVLDKTGNFYTENLRAAKAQDTYILSGKGEEIFEPHFTFHGFRYIRVEGYPGELSTDQFSAVALYSDMPLTGTFTCSNPLINQLQHNIQWGQQGNFLDVPTDCPQRDERLGWTGDAQVFSRTAAYNRGVDNFFAKWLKDMAADQSPDGAVPFVIPNVLGDGRSAGWADAVTVIPWNMFLAYGDKRRLGEAYPAMKAWVDYMRGQSKKYLWNTGFHFGDWLFYRPQDDNDGRAAVTDKYLIAQCFYAQSTQLLIDAARVLGNTRDEEEYGLLLKSIREAFLREYLTPNGRLVSGTQTAYTLALQFDMLPESLRTQAAERLAQNIKDYGYHLTTGFLGTPYLCHVLSRYGYTDIAYKLLLQETYPSWLYPVKMGATTIWERWDGIRPDSSFQTPGMNSFNHYSYGAIGDWMYRVVAGIDTYEDGAGYKHIKICPHPGGGLTQVTASLETYYGPVSSHWEVSANGEFLLKVSIPANTTATVYVPAKDQAAITEGGQPLSAVKEIGVSGMENGYVVLKVGSGDYHFRVAK